MVMADLQSSRIVMSDIKEALDFNIQGPIQTNLVKIYSKQNPFRIWIIEIQWRIW
jgi:hypothetical protein